MTYNTSNFKKLLYFTLWVGVIVFIFFYSASNLEKLQEFEFKFEFKFIMISLIFVIFAYIVSIYVWIDITRKSGFTETWHSHGRTWALSRIGRYLPGKFATYLIRFEGYTKYPKLTIGLALYTEMLSMLVSASTFILVVSLFGVFKLPSPWNGLILVFTSVCLVFSFTNIFRNFINYLLKIRGLPPIKIFPKNTTILKAILIQFVVIFFHGMSLYFTINSISYVSIIHIFDITAIYFFSGLVGILSVFAPGGLGVREGVLIFFLPLIIAFPVALASAVLIRLITMCGEIIMAITLVIVNAYYKKA